MAALCASFGACAPSSLRSRLAPWPAWAACRPRRPCAISGLCPSCRGRRFGGIRVLCGVRVYLAALWCRFMRAGARHSLNFPKNHLTRFGRFSPLLAVFPPCRVSWNFTAAVSPNFGESGAVPPRLRGVFDSIPTLFRDFATWRNLHTFAARMLENARTAALKRRFLWNPRAIVSLKYL